MKWIAPIRQNALQVLYCCIISDNEAFFYITSFSEVVASYDLANSLDLAPTAQKGKSDQSALFEVSLAYTVFQH